MSDAARERRAAERRRRRDGGQAEPAEGAVDTAELVEGLRNAASAAAVGAAVGAARAIALRRGERDDTPEEPPEEGDPEETQEPQDWYEPPAADEAPDEREQHQQHEQPQAATPGEVREQVRRARALMRDLHSTDAESVSSVVRGANGWTVGLEVVEVRRIPDSTDVLASYEVQLDDDGCILRFERVRRYHRSEAQRGGRV